MIKVKPLRSVTFTSIGQEALQEYPNPATTHPGDTTRQRGNKKLKNKGKNNCPISQSTTHP